MSVPVPVAVPESGDHDRDIWDSICDLEVFNDFRDRNEAKLFTMAKAIASAEKHTERKRGRINLEVMTILATGGIDFAHMNTLLRDLPVTRAHLVQDLNAQTDKLKSLAIAVEKMQRETAAMEDTTPNRRDLETCVKEIETELQIMMGDQWCSRHLKPKISNTGRGRLGTFAAENMPAWF